jgi:hypothetical protein
MLSSLAHDMTSVLDPIASQFVRLTSEFNPTTMDSAQPDRQHKIYSTKRKPAMQTRVAEKRYQAN